MLTCLSLDGATIVILVELNKCTNNNDLACQTSVALGDLK